MFGDGQINEHEKKHSTIISSDGIEREGERKEKKICNEEWNENKKK
jgi:hypothetical protein